MTAQVFAFPDRIDRAILPAAKPAAKARAKRVPKPFTLPHFRAWASDLILDTGESWHPEDFQEWFAADLFSGAPEVWFIVPEGNGKTTLVAGISLYHTEFRPFASVPVAASSREQAEILYRQAEGFVLRSPRLHHPVHSAVQAAKGKRKLDVPRFTCLEGYRRINHHAGGRIQVFAADDRTGDGIIPTLAIPDELHRHRDLGLYRTWSGKLAKRDGQIAAISTAGEPGSDFELTREKIRQTATEVKRKGSFTRAVSGRVILHEWSVPDQADVTDMAVVKAANPLSTITVGRLEEKYSSPTMTLEHWRRFVCNLATRSSSAAVAESDWRRGYVTEPIPDGQPVDLGLDVAWKWDTSAAVPLWWKSADWRQFGPAEIMVPPRDGSLLDPELVKAALARIHARNPILTVVMDMAYAADIASWIATEIGAEVVDRAQTPAMATQDYERFMEALGAGLIKHAGDPGLTTHVLNAVTKGTDSGTRFWRPAEGRQSSEQNRRVIDALTAGSMVHSFVEAQRAAPLEPEVKPWVIVR